MNKKDILEEIRNEIRGVAMEHINITPNDEKNRQIIKDGIIIALKNQLGSNFEDKIEVTVKDCIAEKSSMVLSFINKETGNMIKDFEELYDVFNGYDTIKPTYLDISIDIKGEK